MTCSKPSKVSFLRLFSGASLNTEPSPFISICAPTPSPRCRGRSGVDRCLTHGRCLLLVCRAFRLSTRPSPFVLARVPSSSLPEETNVPSRGDVCFLPKKRLSLPEGTFVSSRRDVRLFPKGRLLSAIGIPTTHSLSVTAIAPWGVVGDGECEKGKQGRGFVRRATPRQSGGRSRG